MELKEALKTFPFIAILRGIKPEEISEAGRILTRAGFRIIEIPLNSPAPYDSLRALCQTFGSDILSGAGTVLEVSDVDNVIQAGGKLIVSPNCNPEVIVYAKACGLLCLPGVATPSEAFAALNAGADGLKIFPAELVSPPVLKAMKAVLPEDCLVLPVGGITPSNWRHYSAAGVAGFGLGSALYKAGMSMDELRANAEKFRESLENA